MSKSDFYYELFKRNQPVISASTQEKIRNLRVLVAGCGSTGGAFIEGASRLGVINYHLAEPDHYDLHNLNRQFAYQSDIGLNKAQVHATRLQQLFANCDSQIEVETKGIQIDTIDDLLDGIDLVFDAVDVTTKPGMQAKLLLHEQTAKRKYPVLSALDLGFKQWIRVFDYRLGGEPLDGKWLKAKNCNHPLKALIEGFCPIDELSVEISDEVLRLLDHSDASVCQIAAPCHLLAALTGPLLIRFIENKSLPKIISFDLMRHLEDQTELTQSEVRKKELQKEIYENLKKVS